MQAAEAYTRANLQKYNIFLTNEQETQNLFQRFLAAGAAASAGNIRALAKISQTKLKIKNNIEAV